MELIKSALSDCGIYFIRLNGTDRYYIGSSTDRTTRLLRGGHFQKLRIGKHVNAKLQNAFNKYGEGAFSWGTLEDCGPHELLDREDFFIDKYDAVDNGFNIARRACRPPRFCDLTAEQQQRLIKIRRLHRHTAKTKRRMSIARLGMKLSDETKRRISVAQLGRQFSDETKRRISVAQLGRTHSEETKRRISVAQLWRKLSEENKRRMSIRMRKPVVQVDVDGSIIKKFPSGKDAAMFLGIPSSSISSCLHNRQKTAGGFKWIFDT